MEKDRIGVSDIIREMRKKAAKDTYIWPAEQLEEWAEALEQAMREPFAWWVEDADGYGKWETNGYAVRFKPDTDRPGRTVAPLFALPPDASGQPTATEYLLTLDVESLTEERNELEKKVEHWRDEAKRFAQNVEHWRQETRWRDAEIERLKGQIKQADRILDLHTTTAEALMVGIKERDAILDAKDAEIERLREALHQISLCSQNSMSSKEECGRIARTAIAPTEDK